MSKNKRKFRVVRLTPAVQRAIRRGLEEIGRGQFVTFKRLKKEENRRRGKK